MYLDDMRVFDVEERSVQELLAILGMQIRIEDKGVSEWFLRIKNHVGEKSITVSQEKYVKKQSKNGLCKILNQFMNLWLHLKMQLMIKF